METRKEQLQQWNSISAAPGGDNATSFLLDKIRKNGIHIEDMKCITAEQVEFLLSERIAVLIERGRKNCPIVRPDLCFVQHPTGQPPTNRKWL